MNNSKSDLVDMELRLLYETEKAVCVIDDDSKPNAKGGVWLPKSQIEIENIFAGRLKGTRLIKLSVPEWLAERENLL